VYNVLYALEVWKRPLHTNIGFNLEARNMWVRRRHVNFGDEQVSNLMAEAGGRILAIQALRNSTMSATFFGTMSVTIGFFVGKIYIFLLTERDSK
jgi:hypothetical protein